MSHDKCNKSEAILSERDKLTEQVIAALKYLADQCRKTGLTEYGDVVEDALDRCLKQYVDDQRNALARKIGDDETDACPSLN